MGKWRSKEKEEGGDKVLSAIALKNEERVADTVCKGMV